MRVLNDSQEIAAAAGEELGVSEWVTISQERIDMFADATAIASGSTSIPNGRPRGRSAQPSRTAT